MFKQRIIDIWWFIFSQQTVKWSKGKGNSARKPGKLMDFSGKLQEHPCKKKMCAVCHPEKKLCFGNSLSLGWEPKDLGVEVIGNISFWSRVWSCLIFFDTQEYSQHPIFMNIVAQCSPQSIRLVLTYLGFWFWGWFTCSSFFEGDRRDCYAVVLWESQAAPELRLVFALDHSRPLAAFSRNSDEAL